MRITGRRLRAVERAMKTTASRWLAKLTADEINALVASMPPSEMDAEIATWTIEQFEAYDLGVPLERIRAMGARKADG